MKDKLVYGCWGRQGPIKFHVKFNKPIARQELKKHLANFNFEEFKTEEKTHETD